jgi:hypothetical protein
MSICLRRREFIASTRDNAGTVPAAARNPERRNRLGLLGLVRRIAQGSVWFCRGLWSCLTPRNPQAFASTAP